MFSFQGRRAGKTKRRSCGSRGGSCRSLRRFQACPPADLSPRRRRLNGSGRYLRVRQAFKDSRAEFSSEGNRIFFFFLFFFSFFFFHWAETQYGGESRREASLSDLHNKSAQTESEKSIRRISYCKSYLTGGEERDNVV